MDEQKARGQREGVCVKDANRKEQERRRQCTVTGRGELERNREIRR